MKDSAEIKPNYAPIYAAALYPELAKIFQKHGYALAVHGSLARDLDLIAIPWIEKPFKTPEEIIKEITTTFWIRQIDEPVTREHGRLIYTISVGHGECSIDLSFTPLNYENRTNK